MTCLLHILIVSHKFILYAIAHTCQWHATHAIHIIITHTKDIHLQPTNGNLWMTVSSSAFKTTHFSLYIRSDGDASCVNQIYALRKHIHAYMWRSSRTRCKNIPNIYFEIPVTLFYNLVIHYLFAVAHARTHAPAAHQREEICDAYFAKIRIMCSFYMAAAQGATHTYCFWVIYLLFRMRQPPHICIICTCDVVV